MERSSVRISKEDQRRIKGMAARMGMSQEKFIGWMVEQTEKHMQNNGDTHSPAGRKGKMRNGAGGEFADINHYDLLMEIKSAKRVIYRMIKELCRITDSDVNDPDSGITMRAKYDDQLQHPEKYRRRYTSTYGKRK